MAFARCSAVGGCIFSTLCTLVVFPFILGGCTVLEDRSACPWYLCLDFSPSANGVCDSVLVNVCSEGGFSYTECLGREDFLQEFCVKVPSHVGVYVNVLEKEVGQKYFRPATLSSPGVTIPSGQQCPETYMYSTFCSTEAGQMVDSVKIHKNWCGVTMTFVSEDMGEYDITVRGNVSGYAIDGAPSGGEFRYRPFDGNPTKCYFRIPRQTDASLQLSVADGSGPERVFALGNYILQSGYDWKKEDLDDISVSIDYAASGLSVNVNGWRVQEKFDITI